MTLPTASPSTLSSDTASKASSTSASSRTLSRSACLCEATCCHPSAKMHCGRRGRALMSLQLPHPMLAALAWTCVAAEVAVGAAWHGPRQVPGRAVQQDRGGGVGASETHSACSLDAAAGHATTTRGATQRAAAKSPLLRLRKLPRQSWCHPMPHALPLAGTIASKLVVIISFPISCSHLLRLSLCRRIWLGLLLLTGAAGVVVARRNPELAQAAKRSAKVCVGHVLSHTKEWL